MKKRLSFKRLLHNDKLMTVFSLILAVFIWQSVVYGPSNVITSNIGNVPVSTAMTNAYAQENNLRVIGADDVTATVQVSGQRSVVDRLSASEFTLSADTSGITSPGTYVLPIKVARSSTNYDIVSITPSSVEVVCDYWISADFTVKTEINGLSVTDPKHNRLGKVSLSGDAITDGRVTLEGPMSQIEKVAGVVARVGEKAVVDTVAVYSTVLTALDDDGNEADISRCRYVGASSNAVTVTVPVEVYRRIDFTCKLTDVPSGYNADKLLTLTPSYIEVWGSAREVETLAASVSDLGSISFRSLRPETLSRSFYLDIPETVTMVGSEYAVTATVNLNNLGTSTLTVPLDSHSVTFEGLPEGYEAALTTPQLTVTLYGPAKTVKTVKPSQVHLNVDLSSVTGEGQYTPDFTVNIASAPTAWAYFGETGTALSVGVTVTAAP